MPIFILGMDKILVIDYGSQYNELIVRRVRDLGVYALLVDNKNDLSSFDKSEIKGIILSGGPNSVNDPASPKVNSDIFNFNVPILGICYGMQALAYYFGGTIEENKVKEYGNTEISFDLTSKLFKGMNRVSSVFMSHSDTVIKLPRNFKGICSSRECEFAGMEDEEHKIYALQFHPEVRNTVEGKQIISNFLFEICGVFKNWSIDNWIEDKVKEIKNFVKDEKVLLGISGGVDSSVCAVLIHKAIGDQLYPVFINHGLLRQDEEKLVLENFKNKLGIKVYYRDASKEFLSLLKGVSSPEKKRKIIGKTFIDVFKEEAKKFEGISILAQGTLYTDVVESGKGGNSKVIKSHHNVGGLPKELGFKLLEPLNELYKDEVRVLGRKLGLDESFVSRQPFPGPGLAIRIIGSVSKRKLDIVRKSDVIFQEEIKKAGLDKKIWQYFAVLTNTKTVGVMGDNRTYLYTVALRAVDSIDGMTAKAYPIPYDVLEKASSRIVNEVPYVNKVVYDITSKPPSTIEFE